MIALRSAFVWSIERPLAGWAVSDSESPCAFDSADRQNNAKRSATATNERVKFLANLLGMALLYSMKGKKQDRRQAGQTCSSGRSLRPDDIVAGLRPPNAG